MKNSLLSPEYFEKAGFAVRFLAYTIDKIIIAMIDMVFIGISIFIVLNIGDNIAINFSALDSLQPSQLKFSVIFLLLYIMLLVIKIGYFTYFIGTTGQTIGKMIMGIKVISSDEKELNYSKAATRCIGYIASSAPLWLGFFWVIFDENREAWHDKITGTWVVAVE